MHETSYLLLDRALAETLQDQAKRTGRWEACGVLIGDRDSSGCARAVDVVWLPNHAPVPDAFLMHVRDVVAAEARAWPHHILAIVHTHGAASPPSVADLRSACESPWPWVMATPQNLELIPIPRGVCSLQVMEAQA